MSAAELLPGARVGEAQVLRRLASGKVATVYEVRWRGQRCALKMVHDLSEDPSLLRRLAQEGALLARVEHPNVVRFLESGVHEGHVWVLLELVDGRSLCDLLRQEGGQVPAERAVALVRQVCQGLLAVHRRDIVHRDIHPGNILVTADDHAKLTDFGSARLPGLRMKTTNVLLLVSHRYAAPELWGGETATAQADVFSLGVVLHELVSGRNPIVEGECTPASLFHSLRSGNIATLLSHCPDAPADLAALVEAAKHPDPSRRCTAAELEAGLDALLLGFRAPRILAAHEVLLRVQVAALPPSEDREAGSSDYGASSPGPMPAPRRTGRGGTEIMAAVGEGGAMGAGPSLREGSAMGARPSSREAGAVGAGPSLREGDRSASPPPPPPEPSSVPATLRVLSRPPPGSPLSLPIPSIPFLPAPAPLSSAPPPAAAPPEEPRRSTGIPVASGPRPSLPSTRRRALGVLGACGLLAAVAAGVAWTLFGSPPSREGAPAGAPAVAAKGPASGAALAPAPAPRPPPRPPASAPTGSPSASAPPRPSAPPPRPPPRPHR